MTVAAAYAAVAVVAAAGGGVWSSGPATGHLAL